MTGRRIAVTGTVQGVGFRPWVYRVARELGVAGRVRNDDAGVVIDAFAAEPVLEAFVARLGVDAPGRVRPSRGSRWATRRPASSRSTPPALAAR